VIFEKSHCARCDCDQKLIIWSQNAPLYSYISKFLDMANPVDYLTSFFSVGLLNFWFTAKARQATTRGVATGGIWGIYTLPKSGQVNFLWGNNDVRTVIEHFIPPKKLLYLPKTNFWLRPCIGIGAQSTLGGHQIFAQKYVLKISKMPEFYMNLARKIIKIPEFLWYLPEKFTKFPNFTWFLPEKCPNFT